MRKRLHHPGPVKRLDGNSRVQHRQGSNTVRLGCGDLETDRTTDVVYHQVEAIQFQCVDGGSEPAAQPGPAVVGVRGTLGETQPGKIDSDTAQSAGR